MSQTFDVIELKLWVNKLSCIEKYIQNFSSYTIEHIKNVCGSLYCSLYRRALSVRLMCSLLNISSYGTILIVCFLVVAPQGTDDDTEASKDASICQLPGCHQKNVLTLKINHSLITVEKDMHKRPRRGG